MKHCIICGGVTTKPIQAAFTHFWIYQPGQWKFWKGNIRTFGFWGGLRGSLGITFPIFDTLINWRHRKSVLVIPVGADVEIGEEK